MIKYFRLIHLLLLLLAAFVIWQLNPLVNFFSSFVANGYVASITEHMASNYISVFVYLSLLIMFALLIMMHVLLTYKKKPTKIYLMAIIYYVVLFLGILIAAHLLTGLEEELWTTTNARMYRDIATMIVIPQYFFLPFWLIRALGFNVKQFNFKADLQELNLSQADSEEVEINFGFETYKARRIFNRFKREFKYYAKENKFIIIALIGLIVIITTYVIVKNYEVYAPKYNIGQTFTITDFAIKVEDSIISNLNYAGEVIDNNKYYFLLKVTATNNNQTDALPLEYSKFLLYGDGKSYQPNLNISSQFIDYAKSYHGEKIKAGETDTIVLAYELDKKAINSDFYLSVYSGTSVKKQGRLKSANVDLTPVIISQTATVQQNKLNELITFNSTYLNDTSFMVKAKEITSRYIYDYESCFNNNCNTLKEVIVPDYRAVKKQTLLILDYEFTLDETTDYAEENKTVNKFINNFFKVRYKLADDDTEYVAKVKDITPSKLKDKLALQVPEEITKAETLELLITIRNKTYVINLNS